LHILIVSQYFWPENFRITDLAIALKEKGHDVVVLTGMPNYPSGKLYEGYSWWKNKSDEVKGISVIRVPLFVRRDSKSWQLAVNFLSFVISACFFAPWFLRKKRFDIIFCYGPSPVTVAIPAILMSKLKRAPLFFWVQDLWPEAISATGAIKSPFVISLVRRMVKSIYRYCDIILVQSKSFIEPVICAGAKREKVRYFPNWAESLYKPIKLEMNAPERQEVPDSGFVVMFAGNLGVAQSLDTIIATAEKLKEENIHWVFLGDGRKRCWLADLVAKKQLDKVHILGSRPIETMPAYFSLADVMLVTLKADPIMSTTIPGKVQSYLACKRPIVGALNGAGAKVINDSRSGYSVDSDDVENLATCILKMSRLSIEERDEMGKAALDYYHCHFDRDMLVDQLQVWMEDQ